MSMPSVRAAARLRWLLPGLVLFVAAAYAEDDWLSHFGQGAGPPNWVGDLTPVTAADWSYAKAAHLLERAGFGGTPQEIEPLAAMSPEQAVATLVDYDSIDAEALLPFEESGVFGPEMLADLADGLNFRGALARARQRGSVYGVEPREGGVRPYQPIVDVSYYRKYAPRHEWLRVANWWAERMMLTPRPLEEKMTLFWHGHFATEQEKVMDYRLMLDQNTMLREHATGSFRDLLIGASKDPAMLIYLDNRKNVVGHANENYAREIMELFALGVGNYSEDDIKEAARAFTGWRNEGRRFVDDRQLHDAGEKTILGRTGNFDGEDVVDILLGQEVCARFIAGKIYRFLVREDLGADLEESLAAILRDADYQIAPLLRAIFLSRDFYAPPAFATRVKGPVGFLVSTYRKLGLERMPGSLYFPLVSTQLGQALGDPPNVAGWAGGRSWINPSTLIERGNVIGYLLFPERQGEAYRYGPFEARYQRYQFAPIGAYERDRVAAMGAAAPSSEGAMMAEGPSGAMPEGVMATDMKKAPSATMINETPRHDVPLGVYNGMNRAFRTILPVDQSPADFDLASMLKEADVTTTADAVGYLSLRFLRLPLDASDRRALEAFLRDRTGDESLDFAAPSLERDLRELLHLILSTPEYQLG